MSEIGTAYLQIIPSMKGVKGALSEGLGDASSVGTSVGESIAGKIKGAIVAAGIGTAVTKVFKDAIDEGAALEQSIGGIQTLFGTQGADSVEEYASIVGKTVDEVSADFDKLKQAEETMTQYANEAWQTAGMSANDYNELVTSFAASLKQSTGDDFEALTTAANQAVIDIADNANKFGTNMEDIENAYKGFAKQNYTMLDNLKLGYGGTKSEMERLLADAEEISGIEYNIDNLDDVYAAVHVIQTELGVTGTTAEEAAETFSGSFNSMKSAWKNLLGFMATGQDITEPLQALVESATTFLFGNALPMIGNVITQIPQMIGTALTQGIPLILDNLTNIVTQMAAAARSTNWAEVGLAISDAIANLFSGDASGLLTAAMELIYALTSGIITAAPILIDGLMNTVAQMVDNLLISLPTFIETGGTMLMSLLQGIFNHIPDLLNTAVTLVESLISSIVNNLPQIVSTGVDMLLSLVDGITGNLPYIVQAAIQAITSLVTTIVSNLPQIISAGIQIIASLVSGLAQALPQVVSTVLSIGGTIIDTFLNTDWLGLGKQIISGIASGISNSAGSLFSSLKNLASNALSTAKSALGIHSPSKLFRDQVGAMIGAGVVEGITGTEDDMQSALTGLSDLATMPQLALATSTGTVSSGYVADTDGEMACYVTVNVGQERLEKIITKAIVSRNYKTGGA